MLHQMSSMSDHVCVCVCVSVLKKKREERKKVERRAEDREGEEVSRLTFWFCSRKQTTGAYSNSTRTGGRDERQCVSWLVAGSHMDNHA